MTRDFCSASLTEPPKNQIATLNDAAEIDDSRAGSTLPAPNIRQNPLTELLRYSLPEVLRLAENWLSSLPVLPTIVIGPRDLTFEARSMQDLEALADALLLWDQRDKATSREAAQGRRAARLAGISQG